VSHHVQGIVRIFPCLSDISTQLLKLNDTLFKLPSQVSFTTAAMVRTCVVDRCQSRGVDACRYRL
jgi:hypothetical protein